MPDAFVFSRFSLSPPARPPDIPPTGPKTDRLDMRPLDTHAIQEGQTLPKHLYTAHGAKLLSRGVLLTPELIAAVRALPRNAVYLADSVHDLHKARVVVAAPQRPVGEVATEDLVTAGGVLAAEAGDEIEEHHDDAYTAGSFRPDAATLEERKLRARRLRLADQAIADRARTWANLPLKIEPAPGSFEVPEPVDLGAPNTDGLERRRNSLVKRFRDLFGKLIAGVPTDAADPLALVDEQVHLLETDPAAFAQLALLTPRRPDYLPDQCVATMALSIGIAANLNWSRDDVRLAGLSGLLADVGMGLVAREIRAAERPLTDEELNRVRRHPAHAVVLLDEMSSLPEPVKLAAHQHHERDDGSGYPLMLKRPKIADLARVVAVAGAYAAATNTRPYRSYKRPYDALAEMIRLGSRGVLDRRCVRALAHAIGLFPVGSYVRLSTGQLARVVASHPSAIDRPVVHLAGSDADGLGGGSLLDLRAQNPHDLSVIHAADPPEVLLASARGVRAA